jgi:hypothetical protein
MCEARAMAAAVHATATGKRSVGELDVWCPTHSAPQPVGIVRGEGPVARVGDGLLVVFPADATTRLA